MAHAGRGPADELVPAGFRLRPDPAARTLAGGTVITGGYPTRVLRLSAAGARHVAGWWSGTPVPGNPKARALARRLLDIGIAHPAPAWLDVGLHCARRPRAWPCRVGRHCAWRDTAPAVQPGADDVTVVIPVRDRAAELARCLAGLADARRVIVVDDGSRDQAAVNSAAAAAGACVLRRPVNGGPAAARNTGLAAAETPLVAFLDLDRGARPRLAGRAAAAFRRPRGGRGRAPHRAARGRADLAGAVRGGELHPGHGTAPSIVRPASRVPYVPGAALVVRRMPPARASPRTCR